MIIKLQAKVCFTNFVEKKLGFANLVPLLQSECNLEYLGFSRNKLECWEDVKPLLSLIGRFPLTQQQVDEVRAKEKEREAIITKNIKVLKLIYK
jgi:hypothetical protein